MGTREGSGGIGRVTCGCRRRDVRECRTGVRVAITVGGRAWWAVASGSVPGGPVGPVAFRKIVQCDLIKQGVEAFAHGADAPPSQGAHASQPPPSHPADGPRRHPFLDVNPLVGALRTVHPRHPSPTFPTDRGRVLFNCSPCSNFFPASRSTHSVATPAPCRAPLCPGCSGPPIRNLREVPMHHTVASSREPPADLLPGRALPRRRPDAAHDSPCGPRPPSPGR